LEIVVFNERIDQIGFQHPIRRARPLAARRMAFTQLVMTAALILSIVIAGTAVSIGIARAACGSSALSCHLPEQQRTPYR
jgi:hypothetical protein